MYFLHKTILPINHLNLIIGGYTADHPVIKIFWRVVESFTDEEKRKLLKFVTSCSRPPLLGFKVYIFLTSWQVFVNTTGYDTSFSCLYDFTIWEECSSVTTETVLMFAFVCIMTIVLKYSMKCCSVVFYFNCKIW